MQRRPVVEHHFGGAAPFVILKTVDNALEGIAGQGQHFRTHVRHYVWLQIYEHLVHANSSTAWAHVGHPLFVLIQVIFEIS